MVSNVRSETSGVDQQNAILEQAIVALGGRENLDALASFSIESRRVRYVMGQGPDPIVDAAVIGMCAVSNRVDARVEALPKG